MEQDQTRVDEIEGMVWQARSGRVSLHDFRRHQLALGDQAAAHVDEARLALDPEDPAVYTHSFGQQIQYADRSTAHVDDPPTRLNPELVE